MIQGSPEWHRARLGKVTASRVADVVAKTKSGPAASRANYAAQLLTERLTDLPTEGFMTAAMQWGVDQEPAARESYEYRTGLFVDPVAFVDHPVIAMSGASPDGHVGDDGSIEIKCPNTATHIETLLSGRVPGKYRTQVLWQLACTGRKWCDFVSFHPRLPPRMQLFIERIHRDDGEIAALEAEVTAFLTELAETEAKLRLAYPEPVREAA